MHTLTYSGTFDTATVKALNTALASERMSVTYDENAGIAETLSTVIDEEYTVNVKATAEQPAGVDPETNQPLYRKVTVVTPVTRLRTTVLPPPTLPVSDVTKSMAPAVIVSADQLLIMGDDSFDWVSIEATADGVLLP